MPLSAGDERRIRHVLKQLDLTLLYEVGISSFGKFSPGDVKNSMRRLKLTRSKAHVMDVIIDLLKETDITPVQIENILPSLELYGVALKGQHRKWTAFTMIGEPLNEEWLPHHVEKCLKRTLRKHSAESIINAIFWDGICWIRIAVKRLKNHRLWTMHPVYCATFLYEPYFFMSRQSPTAAVLQSIAESFGYTDYKYSSLDGYHLHSLLKHLKNKSTRPGNAIPVTLSRSIISTQNLDDYSQNMNRRKYMDQLLGTNPPELANFCVEARDVPWRGLQKPEQTGRPVVKLKALFKTRDTALLFRAMAEDGIINTPPPIYVKGMLNTGKNAMILRPKGTNSMYSDMDKEL